MLLAVEQSDLLDTSSMQIVKWGSLTIIFFIKYIFGIKKKLNIIINFRN